jgi:hypothetical protein
VPQLQELYKDRFLGSGDKLLGLVSITVTASKTAYVTVLAHSRLPVRVIEGLLVV